MISATSSGVGSAVVPKAKTTQNMPVKMKNMIILRYIVMFFS